MLRIGALVSGGGTNLQAVIDAIEKKEINAEIGIVISSNPNAYALCRAKKHNLPSACLKKKDYKTPGDYEKELIYLLKNSKINLIITMGFNIILHKSFIEQFPLKIINVHPSLIPSFCGKGFYGLKVHEAVLAAGVKVTGATVHFVNEITDGGPIILQKPVMVLDNDTPEILQRRVMEEAEWKILPKAIKLISENKLIVRNNKVCGASLN